MILYIEFVFSLEFISRMKKSIRKRYRPVSSTGYTVTKIDPCSEKQNEKYADVASAIVIMRREYAVKYRETFDVETGLPLLSSGLDLFWTEWSFLVRELGMISASDVGRRACLTIAFERCRLHEIV
jgi:hypothetical protein